MIKFLKKIFRRGNEVNNSKNIDHWDNINDEILSDTVMKKLLELNSETNFNNFSIIYVYDESQLPKNPYDGELVYVISNNKIYIYTPSGWTKVSF